MTAMSTEEDVDLSDLDLLDDEKQHGICLRCNPGYQPGMPYVAVCGTRVVDFGPIIEDHIPPGACRACLSYLYRRCPQGDHDWGAA